MCEEVNGYSADAYVNECEGDYTDEVTDKTCVSRTGRKAISCRWRHINKCDSDRVEVHSRLVAREIKQMGTDS